MDLVPPTDLYKFMAWKFKVIARGEDQQRPTRMSSEIRFPTFMFGLGFIEVHVVQYRTWCSFHSKVFFFCTNVWRIVDVIHGEDIVQKNMDFLCSTILELILLYTACFCLFSFCFVVVSLELLLLSQSAKSHGIQLDRVLKTRGTLKAKKFNKKILTVNT